MYVVITYSYFDIYNVVTHILTSDGSRDFFFKLGRRGWGALLQTAPGFHTKVKKLNLANNSRGEGGGGALRGTPLVCIRHCLPPL